MIVFTQTTKNFDAIEVVELNNGWYEVYFNSTLVSEAMSYQGAIREVERQLSL